MKTTSFAVLAFVAVGATTVAAYDYNNYNNEDLLQVRSFDDEELEPRLVGGLIKAGAKLAVKGGKAAAHAVANRHRNKNKRSLYEEEDELDSEMYARAFDDEELEPRLVGGLIKAGAKLAVKGGKAAAHAVANRHRSKNKRSLYEEEEEIDSEMHARTFDDEELEPRLVGGLIKAGAKLAVKGGKAAAHAVANRHRNKNKRSLADEEDELSFEERSFYDAEEELDTEMYARAFDDEELEPRLVGGLIKAGAKLAVKGGKAAAHAVANRHRNKNKRSLYEEEELDLDARDLEEMLEGLNDFEA